MLSLSCPREILGRKGSLGAELGCLGRGKMSGKSNGSFFPLQEYKIFFFLGGGGVSSSVFDGEGNGNPLQYSCLENPMDGGAWWATVHGVSKSRTRLSNFTFTNWRKKWQPLQCSCLENPRDGGAWWAAVYGVAQSQTRLKRLSSSNSR